MKKTLIVGANSLVATKLAEKIKGHLYGLINISDYRVDHNRYDRVYKSIDELGKEQKLIDIIYLIASFIPYNSFNTPNNKYITTNMELVIQLSKLYPNSKIIFFSSISVYGSNNQLPLNENSYFDNPNLYGLSKIASEFIMKNHRQYSILRISSIWGLGVEKDTFVPRLLKQARENKKILIYGNGSRQQNYLHYSDLVNMALIIEKIKENTTILAVAQKSVSNISLAQKISEKLKVPIEFVGEDNSQSLIFDASQTFKILNYIPKKNILIDIDELL